MISATEPRDHGKIHAENIMTNTWTGGNLQRKKNSKNSNGYVNSYVVAVFVASAISLVNETIWSSLMVLSTVINSPSII